MFFSFFQTTAENRQSYSNSLAENIYDEAYQREEQCTENVYNFSEPQFDRTQESDNDIYNHLHQKPIQMSEAIYGVPKSNTESMCLKIQEHKLWIFVINCCVDGTYIQFMPQCAKEQCLTYKKPAQANMTFNTCKIMHSDNSTVFIFWFKKPINKVLTCSV